MKRNLAFTLVELLVVILIIGILLALVVPNFILMVERSRRSSVRNNMHVIQLGLEAYAVDHSGSYPWAYAPTTGGGFANPGSAFERLILWMPGGDPFGIDGEPAVGQLPVNPYDGRRYLDDTKPVEDLVYEDLYGELEPGQNAQVRGDDPDCPYIDFGCTPDYPGGIGVATYVPDDGSELPSEYGIYGFGRDAAYPMYELAPDCLDPEDEVHWVFFVLHN